MTTKELLTKLFEALKIGLEREFSAMDKRLDEINARLERIERHLNSPQQ